MPLDGQLAQDSDNNVLYVYDGLNDTYQEVKALNAADTFDVGGILTVEGITQHNDLVTIASNSGDLLTLDPSGGGYDKYAFRFSTGSGLTIYNTSDSRSEQRFVGNGNVLFGESGSGNMGVGVVTVPDTKLHVMRSDASGTSNAAAVMTLERNSSTFLQILSNPANSGGILFGDNAAEASGEISYDHSDDSMHFFTAAGERITILSSGDVGIGATSPLSLLHVDGGLIICDTGAADGFGFERAGVAHAVLQEGVTGADEVSLINPLNSDLRLGANGAARWFIEAAGHFNPQANNTYDIGTVTTNEVRDLYIVNAPTVSSNVLNKRMTEPLNIPLMAKLFQALEPIAYADYRDPTVTKWSFPAQAVEKTLDELGLDSSKISFLNHDKLTGGYGLRQGELIAPLVGVVGNHESRIAALEAA